MTINLWWVRRDLRLADNPALRAALRGGAAVQPVFVLDPALMGAPAARRQAFLLAGLRLLDADLRRRGSRLLVRSGPPEQALAQLAAECGAQAVFAGEDYSPYARRRDERVRRALLTVGARAEWVLETTVHHPGAVRKPDGQPYTVFTPFSKAWKALPAPAGAPWQPPQAFPALPEWPSDPLPEPQDSSDVQAALRMFPPGEIEAGRRLAAFVDGPLADYAERRNQLDLDGTSMLSPYLRFGMLPVRQAAAAAVQAAQNAPDSAARRGCEVWLNELIWREFYIAILYHFPYVLRAAFNPALRAVRWRSAPDDLAAWQEGRTGYPVVDACMRQMNQTGWMHNRGRMIVASFLCKDLLINWQEGERYFMRQLVDGDPAANNGGWQWTAGTGTDAAPYFRVFNPVLQGKKFDPDGQFVRRWVPEIAHLPDGTIHEPWNSPNPPSNYPPPMVDHAAARQRVLDAYRRA